MKVKNGNILLSARSRPARRSAERRVCPLADRWVRLSAEREKQSVTVCSTGLFQGNSNRNAEDAESLCATPQRVQQLFMSLL